MSTGLERELFQELTEAFASTLESMTGERPAISWDPLPSPPSGATSRWRQPMPPLSGAIWLLARSDEAEKAGRMVLAAGGIEKSDAQEIRSTHQEILGQTLSALAQALTTRLRSEVSPQNGSQASAEPR